MTTTVLGEGETIPLATIVARCDTLARDLTFKKVVAPELLACMHPGGAENPDESPDGWLVYFAWLHRTHATQGAPTSPSRASDATLNEALEKSIGVVPEFVRFDDGVVRGVYPKSYHALRFLDDLDDVLRIEAAEVLSLEGAHVADWLAVRMRGRALESLAVRLWLWVLTHPGVGLPFKEHDPTPTPPDWTREATPEDLLRVAQAHLRVHAERLSIISAAFPPDPKRGTSRLPLAGFIGAMAREIGRRGRDLMRRWSLGEIFAQSVAAARGAQEAEQRATAAGSREA